MAKRLFLLLFSSFMGIFATPEVLMASDSYMLSGIDDSKAVETVEIVKEEEPVIYQQPTVVVSAPAPVKQPTNYTVTIYKNSVKEYNDSAYDLSYSDIYKYKKMIYGHNSWNLLGSLSDRYIDEVFTITEGGVTRSYQVKDRKVYDKTADGNLQNDKNIMRDITNATVNGATYDIALMTCYGKPLSGGDAAQRLVIFANAI